MSLYIELMLHTAFDVTRFQLCRTLMMKRYAPIESLNIIIMPPPLIGGALNDDARLTSDVCLSVCRVHRA